MDSGELSSHCASRARTGPGRGGRVCTSQGSAAPYLCGRGAAESGPSRCQRRLGGRASLVAVHVRVLVSTPVHSFASVSRAGVGKSDPAAPGCRPVREHVT